MFFGNMLARTKISERIATYCNKVLYKETKITIKLINYEHFTITEKQ
jgi:hypothetical protein